MNQNREDLSRTPAELTAFAAGFAGFLAGAAGVITSSIPAAVMGALLMGASVGFFLLRDFQKRRGHAG